MSAFLFSALFPLTIFACPQSPSDQVMPPGFESRKISVSGLVLHAVVGGKGEEAVVLLHGWPQDWSEWRHVMPLLAPSYQVIAMDLRGVGKSEGPEEGYDKDSMAKDVMGMLDHLGLQRAHIVGHDIGGMVAFSFAANHPDRAISVTIADVPLPGLPSFELIAKDPRAWHFGFHATPHLPETLVTGHEEAYFAHFYQVLAVNKQAITPEDVKRFAAAYASQGQLSAGFHFYRHFEDDAAALQRASLSQAPPLLLLAGEGSMAGLSPMMMAELKAKGATAVTARTVPDAGHWIAEENPAAVAASLLEFFEAVGDGVNQRKMVASPKAPQPPESETSNKGLVVEEIGQGLFWISDGFQQTFFLTTGQGVIAVDAPPSMIDKLLAAVGETTQEPITHVIYSHAHRDHIGAAHRMPAGAQRIAHQLTQEILERAGDPKRPLPTQTFTDRMVLDVGSQRLELSYHGPNHQSGNIIIYAPRQKVLALMDFLFTGSAPFPYFGHAEDIPGFMRHHHILLDYDFNTFISGHIARRATRTDIRDQLAYLTDLQKHTDAVLSESTVFDTYQRLGPNTPIMTAMATWLDEVAEEVARRTLQTWSGKWPGVESVTKFNAVPMVQSRRVD